MGAIHIRGRLPTKDSCQFFDRYLPTRDRGSDKLGILAPSRRRDRKATRGSRTAYPQQESWQRRSTTRLDSQANDANMRILRRSIRAHPSNRAYEPEFFTYNRSFRIAIDAVSEREEAQALTLNEMDHSSQRFEQADRRQSGASCCD